MTLQLDFVEFVTTVQSGSFSKAAAILGVSKSHVSKRVTFLEQRLGVQLLIRTTRKIMLTDIGQVYFESCERILEDVSEAESVVSEIKGELQGVINITLPNMLGETFIVPSIAKFMKQHPKLRVNVSLNTRTVDLLEEGFDLAVRAGKITDPKLVSHKLGDLRYAICATPAYLNKVGTPQTLAELKNSNCIVFDVNGPHNQAFWTLCNGQTEERVPVSGTFTTNTANAMIACVLEHVGLVYMPELFVSQYLQSAQLVQVLSDWSLQKQISVVYPSRRHLSIKVRRLVDFLSKNIDFR